MLYVEGKGDSSVSVWWIANVYTCSIFFFPPTDSVNMASYSLGSEIDVAIGSAGTANKPEGPDTANNWHIIVTVVSP